jgi:hypothetical protein
MIPPLMEEKWVLDPEESNLPKYRHDGMPVVVGDNYDPSIVALIHIFLELYGDICIS